MRLERWMVVKTQMPVSRVKRFQLWDTVTQSRGAQEFLDGGQALLNVRRRAQRMAEPLSHTPLAEWRDAAAQQIVQRAPLLSLANSG
jgi:hypothetical protein